MTSALTVVVAALGLLFTSGPAAARPERKPATHTIVIEASQFTPAEITVARGDTVVWVNKDPFPHTVTSKAGGYDSGAIQPDASWKYVAKSKGRSAYTCTFHPTMKAALLVK